MLDIDGVVITGQNATTTHLNRHPNRKNIILKILCKMDYECGTNYYI